MISEYLITGLVVGITIDILVNDPPNRCHPVSWLGRLIEYFIPKLKDKKKSTSREKINGIIFATSLVVTFGVIIHVSISATLHLFGFLVPDYMVYFGFENCHCNKRYGKTYRLHC